MTIETYVYAIVGVHCKDVVTGKTKNKERGCDHPESASGLPETSAKFCAVCGKKMWIETTVEHHASDKLEHLQEWYGNEEGEVDETAISMIYSQMCGPTEFVVGRVLENMDLGDCVPTNFNVLTDLEWATAYEQTKAALEPLGLWDPEKFDYMLYAISM